MKKNQLEIFATQDLEETIVCKEAPLYYAMAPLHKKQEMDAPIIFYK